LTSTRRESPLRVRRPGGGGPTHRVRTAALLVAGNRQFQRAMSRAGHHEPQLRVPKWLDLKPASILRGTTEVTERTENRPSVRAKPVDRHHSTIAYEI